MTLQERAAALFKWGSKYPEIWPMYQTWCSDIYRRDRVARGIE